MKNNFEKIIQCPLCFNPSSDSVHLYNIKYNETLIAIVECNNCGLHYKDKFPSEELFKSIYGYSYTHYNNINFESQVDELNHRINRIGKPNGKLLDYGCGNGSFVQAAINNGWNAFGSDPFLPDVLDNDDLKNRCIKEDFSIVVKPHEFDCITMWATAEHLVDTNSTFSNLCTSLKTNGTLIFNSPYGNSKIARKNGRNWNMANLVEHLQFQTFESVYYLAKVNNMKVVEIRICGSPYPMGTVPKVSEVSHFSNDGVKISSFNLYSFLLNEVIMKNKFKLKDILSFLIGKLKLGDHIEVKLVKI
jgi:C4-type Zn-finger protein